MMPVEDRRAMFGVELEHQVTVLSPNGSRQPDGVSRFQECLGRHARGLPFAGGGLALENGSRWYVDVGLHEFASAEQAHPLDLVSSIGAAQRTLLEVGQRLVAEGGAHRVVISAANYSYSAGQGDDTSSGVHDNYLFRGPTANLVALMPHLVTLPLLYGSGGVDSCGRFTKSPRARFIVEACSHSASRRGIFDRFLYKGSQRIQFLTGDGCRSHWGPYFRVGSTALLLKLVERGETFKQWQLQEPLAAFHATANGPRVDVPVQRANGQWTTAVELALDLARLARNRLELLPDWSERFCDHWLETLQTLANRGWSPRLDWCILLTLLKTFVRNRRIPWRAKTGLARAARIGPQAVYPLYELCTRYFELGDEGLFEQVAPLFDCRLVDDESMERARTTPAEREWCRSRLRSQFVRRYYGTDGACCDWDRLTLPGKGAADLSDPFARRIRWFEQPDCHPGPASAVLDRVTELYDGGRLFQAIGILRANASRLRQTDETRFLRLTAWVNRALGRFTDAQNALDAIGLGRTLADINQRVLVANCGIVPRPEAAEGIASGAGILESVGNRDANAVAGFLGHRAYCIIQGAIPGSLDDARKDLDRSLSLDVHSKLRTRLMLTQGRVCRMQGRFDDARAFTRAARRIAEEHRYHNDLAASLILAATLRDDRTRACYLARRGLGIYRRRSQDPVGTFRGLCILARLGGRNPDEIRRRLLDLQSRSPVLQDDPIAVAILGHWGRFCAGGPIGQAAPGVGLWNEPFWFV